MREYIETFGTKEKGDKIVLCWKSKKEGAEGWGLTICESVEPVSFDLKGKEAEQYIDKDGTALTLFFGQKSGKKSLRNMIHNMRAMLKEWEEEENDE